VANCAVIRLSLWLFFCVIVLCLAASAHRQASYAAQIRGVVTDQTGAVAVITNNATNYFASIALRSSRSIFLCGASSDSPRGRARSTTIRRELACFQWTT